PRLDAGGSVAARVPPPESFAIGAVMQTKNFAELKRIDDETNVTVPREPRAVVLVSHLVAVTDAVRNHRAVAGEVENRGRGAGNVFREVKIRRDVQAG